MIKSIFRIWKKYDLLNGTLENIKEMFQLIYKNYTLAMSALIENLEEQKDKIYANDKKINALEKDVRLKILEHLTLNPKQDLSYSLIMITVVKDLERIGDYLKNVIELAVENPEKLTMNPYTSNLAGIKDDLGKRLKEADSVFIKSNEKKAKEIYDFSREVTTKTDAIILHILNDQEQDVKDAVLTALLSRYLKRISAHLANIMTSIFNPFHQMGYDHKSGFEDELS
jgi:phosphate transport system protein